MFTLPGLIALLVAHYTKLHEMSPLLQSLPVMPALYIAACIGFLLDLRFRLVRAEACPQLRLVLPLGLWTLVSAALSGGGIGHELDTTLASFVLFLLIAHGLQTFRALRLVALSILAISLFLGVVAVVQARSPFECVLLSANVDPGVVGKPDGRTCETAAECRADAEPGDDYVCERTGPFQTTSVGHGRVRFRGNLKDPNELALVLVIALPLAMGLLAQRASAIPILVPVTSLAITLPVVISTASRTGQLAFVAVIAAFLLHQVSLKRLLAVALPAVLALLVGDRWVEARDQFSMDHVEAWGTGMDMFRSSPLWGIGKSQFIEHHGLTAHNTFVLVAAEQGLVGLILWVGVLYSGFKIAVLALRRYRGSDETTLPYAWARILLATLVGVTIGANLLSLAYHPVIWVFLALPGAFHMAVRRHDPKFRVAFGVRDLLVVTILSIVCLAGIKGYLAARGG